MDDLIVFGCGALAGFLVCSIYSKKVIKLILNGAERTLNECIKDGTLSLSVAKKIKRKWIRYVKQERL